MNLPLQPIDTAPRDGSEVLLYFRSGVSGRRKCIAEWDSASERWSLCGISLTDAAFSGWLDIEALVRDSERLSELEKLVEENRGGLLLHHQHSPVRWRSSGLGLAHRSLRVAIDQMKPQTARAAIDKEMGKCTST